MWIIYCKGSQFASIMGLWSLLLFRYCDYCVSLTFLFFITLFLPLVSDTSTTTLVGHCLISADHIKATKSQTTLHAELEVAVTPLNTHVWYTTNVFLPPKSLNLHYCIQCTVTGHREWGGGGVFASLLHCIFFSKLGLKKTAALCLLSIPIKTNCRYRLSWIRCALLDFTFSLFMILNTFHT